MKSGPCFWTNLTLMKDLTNLVHRGKGSNRELYSNLQRISYTNGKCQMPCITMRYKLAYDNNEEEMNAQARGKYSLVIAFEHFMIEERQEFRACDETCVIGELGGNLGFFLGGSILAFLDITVLQLSKLYKLIMRAGRTQTSAVTQNVLEVSPIK